MTDTLQEHTAPGDASSSADPGPGDCCASDLLAERARRLARPEGTEQQADAPRRSPYLVVRLGGSDGAGGGPGERIGLPLAYLSETMVLEAKMDVPCTPDIVLGAVLARGRIVAVYSLARLLGLGQGQGAERHLVVIADGTMEMGLAVAELEGVLDLAWAETAARPREAREGRYTLGLSPEGVVLLDARALLADETLTVNDAF